MFDIKEISSHQESINNSLKNSLHNSLKNSLHNSQFIDLDILRFKKKIDSLINSGESNLINNLKILKSPLGFYKIILCENDNYTIRLHFYPDDFTETKIHMHGYSAYSHVLSGNLVEDSYIPNILGNNSHFILLNELFFRNHLINFYPGLDENIGYQLKKNTDTMLLNNLIESILSELNIDNNTKLYIKLTLSNHCSISYTDDEIYQLKHFSTKKINSGSGYDIPVFMAHSVKVSKGTITIFIKNNTSILGNFDFPGGNFINLQNDDFDEIENGKGIEITDLPNKTSILRNVLNSLN